MTREEFEREEQEGLKRMFEKRVQQQLYAKRLLEDMIKKHGSLRRSLQRGWVG
jgi:hypothetical protein